VLGPTPPLDAEPGDQPGRARVTAPTDSVDPVTCRLPLDRTRDSYDAVATDYADLLDDELDRKPLDRALLATFGELVAATGRTRVVDLGCGPGRVTAHLAALGLEASGIDLSPGMVAVARRRYPSLGFEVGDLRALDLPDGAVDGVAAWYSIVHTPTEELAQLFAEVRRILRPDGQLVLAFKAGTGCVRLTHAYDHPVSLEVHRHDPARVEDLLAGVGLTVHTRVVREPDAQESTPQAYLLAVAR
jgi:SAM-dependent methyltransferase